MKKIPKDEMNYNKTMSSARKNQDGISDFTLTPWKDPGIESFEAQITAKQILMEFCSVKDKLIACFLSTHPSQLNQQYKQVTYFSKVRHTV